MSRAASTKPGARAKRAVPIKRAVPTGPAATKRASPAAIATQRDLMAHAYAMEAEASERYTEFADAMEAHNNPAVAELFRKLARIEHAHAEEILATMGWTVPPQPAGGKYRWEGLESPESGDSGELHYLMQPYHALQIARANEERARQFFVKLARQAASTALRKAALAFAQEEAEHVRLADEWLARTPEPARGWAEDPDPPLNVD